MVTPRLVRFRITARLAELGIGDGLSNLSRSVFSVEIKKSDMLMLSIVTTARRRFRKALRAAKISNFVNSSMRQLAQDDDLEGKAGRMIPSCFSSQIMG